MNNDDDLVQRIKRLENDIIAYKAPQPVGTSSVLAYTTQTNNIWDVTFNLVGSYEGAPTGYVTYILKWRARNQKSPFGRLRVFAEVDGRKANYGSPENVTSTNGNHVIHVSDDIFYASAAEISDPQLLRFRVNVDGQLGSEVKIKFVVDATDSGIFTLFRSTPNGDQLVPL